MIQHEQAIIEKIERVKSAAKSLYNMTIKYEHIFISTAIERRSRSQPSVDLTWVKNTMTAHFESGIPEGHDFEDIIDEIYYKVVVRYFDSDIRISIFDPTQNVSVEKSFNTHQPTHLMTI